MVISQHHIFVLTVVTLRLSQQEVQSKLHDTTSQARVDLNLIEAQYSGTQDKDNGDTQNRMARVQIFITRFTR